MFRALWRLATIEPSTANSAGARDPRGLRSTGLRRVRRNYLKMLAVGLTVACSAARAGDARADFDFQLAAGVDGGWLRKIPSPTMGALSTNARDLEGGLVPLDGRLFLLGPYVDAAITFDDTWQIPLFGARTQWTVGSYDSLVTSVDGSIVNVRPWTAFRGDLLLPGIGRRWKYRRTMWGATLRTGLSYMHLNGSIAAGADSVPIELSTTTFLFQAEVEACRRLDPSNRVCVFVAPRIYEHELFNGLLVGLRMEWGR
jgi:hypothetical protein